MLREAGACHLAGGQISAADCQSFNATIVTLCLAHIAGSARCSLTIFQRKKIAATRQTKTATIEASGPNAPPVSIPGPLSDPRSTPSVILLPESVIPNSGPSVKLPSGKSSGG